MFTGIVEELGEVVAVDDLGDAARLTVRGPQVTGGVAGGDSIAVNGVCLTVSGDTGDSVHRRRDARDPDPLRLGAAARRGPRSIWSVRSGWKIASAVISSRATSTARARSSRSPAEHWDVVRVGLPPGLSRYVVEKGSIAVDGISLTVVFVE